MKIQVDLVIILISFCCLIARVSNKKLNLINYPFILPEPKNYSINNNSSNIIISSSSFSYEIVDKSGNQNLSPLSYNVKAIFDQYLSKIFYGNCSKNTANKTTLQIHVSNSTILNPSLTTDESYNLTVSSYKIVLQSQTYYGFVRGIETFSQLVQTEKDESSGNIINYYYPTEVFISDSPDFAHRGLMIDSARHFLSKETILRQIDVMMYNKLNSLHWHITDSQSFPLYVSSRPYLSEYGAYNESCVYSINDVSEIIEYGRIRAVRVIPEMDTPGHTRAWALSPQMKDIGVCMDCNWRDCALGPPAGMINPTMEKTYSLVEDVIASIEAQFIDDVVHLGGDEVNEQCMKQEPSIAAWMQQKNISNYTELQGYYTQRERAFLQQGKIAAYWTGSSQLLDKLRNGDIVQYWGKGNETSFLSNFSELKVVLSPADVMYLDCGFPNLLGDASWCDPYNTWRDILSFDPLKNLKHQQVLGAEVCVWGDLTTSDNIERKIWMRGSALADKYWNYQYYQKNSVTKDSVRRLLKMYHHLLNRGVSVDPITSEYCELNVDYCFNFLN